MEKEKVKQLIKDKLDKVNSKEIVKK